LVIITNKTCLFEFHPRNKKRKTSIQVYNKKENEDQETGIGENKKKEKKRESIYSQVMNV